MERITDSQCHLLVLSSRLRMAGVTPEIPGAPSPFSHAANAAAAAAAASGYPGLLQRHGPPGAAGLFDPTRPRNPSAVDMLLRPGGAAAAAAAAGAYLPPELLQVK